MLIKRVFKIAIVNRNYGIPFNAFKGLDITSPHKPRTRRLISNELSVLVYNSEKQRNKYISTIILFALETGMRRSEILKLKWDDANLDTGIATLYDTKNGDDRHIPLTKTAIQLLSNLTQPSEYDYETYSGFFFEDTGKGLFDEDPNLDPRNNSNREEILTDMNS